MLIERMLFPGLFHKRKCWPINWKVRLPPIRQHPNFQLRLLIQKSVEDGLSDYQRTICSDSTSILSRNDRSVAARVSHNMLSPVASASGAEIMAS